MKSQWLVDWKPLPTFLDKRGLLGTEQGEGEGSGPAEPWVSQSKDSTGAPEEGDIGDRRLLCPCQAGEASGLTALHQKPRCAQQLAAHSTVAGESPHSVLLGPRQSA